MASTATRATAPRIPMVRASLPLAPQVWAGFQDILRSGQFSNGRHVRRLEDSICEFLDAPHCVTVSSATVGLTLLLRALELSGEVILPSFTFFATGHALLWNNLVPVFCDSESHSFNLDPERVEEMITPRTSAILAVHVYGNPANAERLEEIARRHRLRLVFDSAHAFGSRRAGVRVGCFGDAEVFSLSTNHGFTAGEGGLVTTRQPSLAATLRKARSYGDPGTSDCDLPGLNTRLTEFHAVLAQESLRTVDREIFSRNEVAALLIGGLDGLPGIRFQQARPNDWSARREFCVLVDETACPLDRAQLASALREQNVETRFSFSPPLHRQKLYQRFVRSTDHLSVAEELSSRVLSLPIHADLSEEEIERLTETVQRTIESARRSDRAAFRAHGKATGRKS